MATEITDIPRLAEGLIVLAGLAAVVYAVFRNATDTQTKKSQKELIDTLTVQVAELRTLHIQNEKDISRLTGEVSVYKELPLKELASSMQQISATQQLILKQLKVNYRNQKVVKQNVEHQHVENKE